MGTHPIFESDFDCLTEWTDFWPSQPACSPDEPSSLPSRLADMVTPVSQLPSSLLIPPTSDHWVLFSWPLLTSQPSISTMTSPSTSERPRPPFLSVFSEKK